MALSLASAFLPAIAMTDHEHISDLPKKADLDGASIIEEVPTVGAPRAANPEEKQARLDAALDIDPGVQAWTLRALQVRWYRVLQLVNELIGA